MKFRFLQPLDVDIEFDDRRYKLGDVIDVTLRITPKRNAFVRKGWVELVCDEHWTDVSQGSFEPIDPLLGAHMLVIECLHYARHG